MKTDRFILLTEGDSKSIGWGHVTRCIALQNGLKEIGFDSTILIKGSVPNGLIKNIKGRAFDWSSNHEYLSENLIYVMDTKNEYSEFKNVFRVTEDLSRQFMPVRKEFWKVKNNLFRSGVYITGGGTKDTTFKTAKQMAKIMNRVKNIKTNSGQTLWETLAMRVPRVDIISSNAEQRLNIKAFNVAHGKKDIYDPKVNTIKFAKEVLKKANSYEINKYIDRDKRAILDLRNKRYVRLNSIDTKRVSNKEHDYYYDRQYVRHNTFVIWNNPQKVIGAIKVNESNHVSIMVNKKYWGLGIGERLLNHIKSIHCELHAHIKVNNKSSQRLFEKCGFIRLEKRNKYYVYYYMHKAG